MATETDKETAQDIQTVTFTLDGREVTVPQGTTVLQAALDQGIKIPYFCWHPKLKPVGACRMCYVEIEKMPKLQVSCATEARDGMVVYTNSDQVKQGRKAVIEFTLINHPLDCPTCDKGGECDLQDLTFAHGFDDSRFDFKKMRHMKEGVESTFDEVRIGPEIILNRNRCILCYKCVRANKEAFGEFDLGAYERGNITEINAAPGEQVNNPFSGNLVEICPVGALTNTDWRYKIRVWLTKQTPGICPYTSSGINILYYKEDHQQKIFRVTSRPNDDIDDGWLPDVTRYGYQVVMADDRLKKPLIKKEGKQVEASWDEALDLVASRLKTIDKEKGNVCIGGMIAPHLDNATLYSFNKFMRRTIGSNNIDYRLDYRFLPKEADSPYAIAASQPFRIADIDTSDVIVVFGSDMIREHPNEYLRMRKAYGFHNARVYSLNPYAVKSADVASLEVVYRPGTDEQVINALCLVAIEENVVDAGQAGDLKGKLSPNSAAEASRACGVDIEDLKLIVKALAEGRKVTFLAGEIVSKSRERDNICAAIANLNRLLGLSGKGQVAVLSRYANSKGAAKLGLGPMPATAVRDRLTQLWGGYPDKAAATTDKMLVGMKKEAINAGVIFGGDPVMLYPDREFVREGLERLDFLVVADMFETETTAIADVVLPLSSWAEYAGEYVNLEGTNQRSEAALKPRFDSRPGHEIIQSLAERMDAPLFENDVQRSQEIEKLLATNDVVSWPDEYLEVRRVVDEPDDEFTIPVFVNDDPHHCGHLTEKAGSLVNFQGEAYIEMSQELADRYDVGHGDSVRVESHVGKVILPVKVSRILEGDVVLIPRNFISAPVTSLLMRKRRLDRVKISKVAG